MSLFDAIFRAVGRINIIAEDLVCIIETNSIVVLGLNMFLVSQIWAKFVFGTLKWIFLIPVIWQKALF